MTVLLPAPVSERATDLAGVRTDVVVRCDRNESAYPPLPAVVSALRDTAASAHRYPSFRPDGLRATIAEHTGVEAAHISVGAGATAVLSAILQDSAARARARGRTGPRIVTPAPTFEGFALLAEMIGLGIDTTPLFDDGRPDVGALAAAAGPDTAAVIVCSPHNPTGSVLSDAEIRELLTAVDPAIPVILDQAYVEYCRNAPDVRTLVDEYPNLIAVRSLSKAHGLAGLRVGYAIGSATSVGGARRHEVPFSCRVRRAGRTGHGDAPRTRSNRRRAARLGPPGAAERGEFRVRAGPRRHRVRAATAGRGGRRPGVRRTRSPADGARPRRHRSAHRGDQASSMSS
ncbi:aminotransferase class I/II-fold pyridoxal phosphate-dependent enzyme [Gordonia sp. SMJS1]|uniref:pyridoxal phosphate-dependent aminotransferase n=1 Tax=Gordonia sp. SMJS1 TaxID=3039400 RepID=UPI0024542A91|nr:aminotransferase class I/II-fold pyridoxal phosphate-dependent enzyme [Gordonia sp. SMJS1]WGJ87647.1 aminotransferase class I/II-fold pyridoxal phosphate-dependent enzyme [Gordonia sp. SMJS1]